MSTLAEIELAVPHLSTDELGELEQIIRKALREKQAAQRPSLRDIEPSSVGSILEPIGPRHGWYDEMLEGQA